MTSRQPRACSITTPTTDLITGLRYIGTASDWQAETDKNGALILRATHEDQPDTIYVYAPGSWLSVRIEDAAAHQERSLERIKQLNDAQRRFGPLTPSTDEEATR